MSKYFTISIDFNSLSIDSYKSDSLAIYSSEDRVVWMKEDTIVDWNTRIAMANVNHFSYFALVGERKDITPPTTTAVLSGDRGEDNWYRNDVELKLRPDDGNGLGIDYTAYKTQNSDWDEYKNPIHFVDEGGYILEFYSSDNDENIEEVKTVKFSIDKTPPVITAIKTPAANSNSWNNSNVTVHFDCTDGGSGVSEVTDDVVLSSEGANQPATGTCIDKAGNSSEMTLSGINIDKTTPSLTAVKTPNTNIDGWNNSDVTVHFDCTDTLSGIDFLTNDQILSSEGANQSVRGSCIDKAGNDSAVEVGDINIDTTQPIVSLYTAPSILWPPDGKTVDVRIWGSAIDNYLVKSLVFNVEDEYNEIKLYREMKPISSNFDDYFTLVKSRKGEDMSGRKYMIKITVFDFADNKSSSESAVLVPHDMGR